MSCRRLLKYTPISAVCQPPKMNFFADFLSNPLPRFSENPRKCPLFRHFFASPAGHQGRFRLISSCKAFCATMQKRKKEVLHGILGEEQLGARLRTRKVTGRDASLPAPLLAASLGLVGRETAWALPQTPQETLSLDPARGRPKVSKSPPRPLFAIELVALSCSFRVQLFGASPKPLFAPPNFP